MRTLVFSFFNLICVSFHVWSLHLILISLMFFYHFVLLSISFSSRAVIYILNFSRVSALLCHHITAVMYALVFHKLGFTTSVEFATIILYVLVFDETRQSRYLVRNYSLMCKYCTSLFSQHVSATVSRHQVNNTPNIQSLLKLDNSPLQHLINRRRKYIRVLYLRLTPRLYTFRK
jgi:hypothetical protein